MKKGKLIVIYGINNIGKSTQAKLLVGRLISLGLKAEYIKYPLYDIEPSGEIINGYLRLGNQYRLSPREVQLFYSLNRTQAETMVMQMLDDGVNIVAEDYTGTGVAWGIGNGVSEEFLKKINSHLLVEDSAILLDGNRYKDATEDNHKHETDNNLIENVRNVHLRLAREYGWSVINANQGIAQIHTQIWDKLKESINTGIPSLTKPTRSEKEVHREPLVEKLSSGLREQQNLVLKVEKISPLAHTPTRAHATDAGLDLYSSKYYTLMPGERKLISTGVKMVIPDGYVGLVWDKSGIAKIGVHTMAGVIDSGYRGEILVNIINLSNNIYTITPGQKVAQLLIQKVENPLIIEEIVKNDTDRGVKGFGSTGL